MTTTTTTRRRTTGRTHDQATFELPGVSDATEALLPPPIRKARALVLDLVAQNFTAASAVHQAEKAIEAAEKADAAALAAAMLAGTTADPGPVNAQVARAAHADAIHRAAGTATALALARAELYEVCRRTDATRSVQALEKAAAELVAPALDVLESMTATLMAARGTMSLAATLDVFPEVPASVDDTDVSAVARAAELLRDSLVKLVAPAA